MFNSKKWTSYNEDGNEVIYNGGLQQYNEIVEENTDFAYNPIDKTISIIKQIPNEANKTIDNISNTFSVSYNIAKIVVLVGGIAGVSILYKAVLK